MKSIKKTIEEKHKEFAAEVKDLSADQLKSRIVGMQQQLAESEAHKEQNEALAQAKADYNELAGGYRDVKKAVILKTKYILELLDEKT